jgi:two-component system, NarL family, sensor histidine kinase UhpB
MSLRARLLASIALILLGVSALGGALFLWRAHRSVEVEMHAALTGARDAAEEALARGSDGPVFLANLVSSFDGQRHVRASLPGHGRSHLAVPQDGAPAWFDALVRVPPESVDVAVSPSLALRLETDPTNEIAEVWKQAEDAFLLMLLFCGASFVAIYVTLGRALGFFRSFDAALRKVGDGGYETRLPESGMPEFARLARGFNGMAARLEGYEGRNRALQQQILTVQEEERSGIARDLHDEVGPYLFAIGVDAEALGSTSIRDAVAHVQKHIRSILRQLRPPGQLEFGLKAALGDLAEFWSRRAPLVAFSIDVAVDDASLDRRTAEVAYRVAQESVSNAIRHGQPKAIAISVRARGEAVEVAVSDDGKGLGAAPSGTGIAGMTERTRALGGTLTVADGTGGQGVAVTALLPRVLGVPA